jgi:hypothetical protein
MAEALGYLEAKAPLSVSSADSIWFEDGLGFDLCGIELHVEAGTGGQRDVGFLWDERVALEVIVVAHLEDEVFAEREGHG